MKTIKLWNEADKHEKQEFMMEIAVKGIQIGLICFFAALVWAKIVVY